MYETVRPKDFYGEEPPARLMGVEQEYKTQLISSEKPGFNLAITDKIKRRFNKESGILTCDAPSGIFLENGGNIHVDVGMLNIAALNVVDLDKLQLPILPAKPLCRIWPKHSVLIVLCLDDQDLILKIQPIQIIPVAHPDITRITLSLPS